MPDGFHALFAQNWPSHKVWQIEWDKQNSLHLYMLINVLKSMKLQAATILSHQTRHSGAPGGQAIDRAAGWPSC
jgi:hypothetical protein